MGGNVGDIDNDGYLDVYFGTGDPDLGRLEPNRFYHNNGNGTFTDLTEYAGMGHLGKGHGITFADYDQDGDLDVYAPQGGWYHGDLLRTRFTATSREIRIAGYRSHFKGGKATVLAWERNCA